MSDINDVIWCFLQDQLLLVYPRECVWKLWNLQWMLFLFFCSYWVGLIILASQESKGIEWLSAYLESSHAVFFRPILVQFHSRIWAIYFCNARKCMFLT